MHNSEIADIIIELVHVHVCQGAPNGNATKIWITKAGGCILCNNNSTIPDRILRNIMDVIEARSSEVIAKWADFLEKPGSSAENHLSERHSTTTVLCLLA